jgi:hypothetical protein
VGINGADVKFDPDLFPDIAEYDRLATNRARFVYAVASAHTQFADALELQEAMEQARREVGSGTVNGPFELMRKLTRNTDTLEQTKFINTIAIKMHSTQRPASQADLDYFAKTEKGAVGMTFAGGKLVALPAPDPIDLCIHVVTPVPGLAPDWSLFRNDCIQNMLTTVGAAQHLFMVGVATAEMGDFSLICDAIERGGDMRFLVFDMETLVGDADPAAHADVLVGAFERRVESMMDKVNTRRRESRVSDAVGSISMPAAIERIHALTAPNTLNLNKATLIERFQ